MPQRQDLNGENSNNKNSKHFSNDTTLLDETSWNYSPKTICSQLNSGDEGRINNILSLIWISGEGIFTPLAKSLINKNCYKSRISNDINMKRGPVTKLDNRTTVTSKNLTITIWQQIMASSSFFRFMGNLGQCGRRIPDTWSIILTFSSMETFH